MRKLESLSAFITVKESNKKYFENQANNTIRLCIDKHSYGKNTILELSKDLKKYKKFVTFIQFYSTLIMNQLFITLLFVKILKKY